MKLTLCFLVSLLVSAPSFATNVAVIDSGIDYKHSGLQSFIWFNENEQINDLDDDGNGLIDDMRGWNFANNHARLIEYEDEIFFDPDIIKFLDIQSRSLSGNATVGEQKWAQQRLSEGGFARDMASYLNYAHGTHVAGIMTQGLDQVKLIDIRIIPGRKIDEAEQNLKNDIISALNNNDDVDFILEFIFKFGLKMYAKIGVRSFSNMAEYLAAKNVKVANASIGLGLEQARSFVAPFLMIIKRSQSISQELIDEYAIFYLNELRKEQMRAFERSADTLFVFAAGNDGVDNDVAPTLPASVNLSNTMAVGASIGYQAVASFSNFGALSVDVFAPGVGVESFAPNERQLVMSGTSQAAPYVASVAARIRDLNPKLSPAETKAIIMGTVDRKSFLKGLAYTEGLVNRERAILAAELSLDRSLSDAIADSQASIRDAASDLIGSKAEPVLIGKPFMPRF